MRQTVHDVRLFFEQKLHDYVTIHEARLVAPVGEAHLAHIADACAEYTDIEVFRRDQTPAPMDALRQFLHARAFERIEQLANFCLFRVGVFHGGYTFLKKEDYELVGKRCFAILRSRYGEGKDGMRLFTALALNFSFFGAALNHITAPGAFAASHRRLLERLRSGADSEADRELIAACFGARPLADA